MSMGRRLILGIVVLLGLLSVWSYTLNEISVGAYQSPNNGQYYLGPNYRTVTVNITIATGETLNGIDVYLYVDGTNDIPTGQITDPSTQCSKSDSTYVCNIQMDLTGATDGTQYSAVRVDINYNDGTNDLTDTYYWDVDATNGATTDVTTAEAVTVEKAIDSPTLVNPADGAIINDQTPTFEWNEVSSQIPAQELNYNLLVATDNGFTNVVIDETLSGTGTGSVSYTPSTNLDEGTYYWKVIVSDPVGNSQESSVRTLTIDVTPPTTTVTAVKSDGTAYTNNTWENTEYVNITLSATDNYDATPTIYYCTDNSNTCDPNTEYTGVIQISEEGVTYVRFYATDDAGNNEDVKVFVVKIDRTNPQIISISPSGYINNTPSKISVEASDVPSGISEVIACLYYIEDSTIKCYDPNTGNAVETASVDDCFNNYGFSLPNVGGDIYEANLQTSGTFFDNREENFTIKVSVEDNTGNTNTAENWFIVDLTDPVLQDWDYSADRMYTDAGGHNWTAGTLYFWVNASDNNGVNSVEVLLNTTTVTLTYNSTSGLWKGSKDTTELSDGFYEIRVRITDVAGRTVEGIVGGLSVDNTAPTISISMEDEDGNTVNSGDYVNKNVSVTIQTNDAGVGVNVTRYRINGGDWEDYTSTLNFSEEGQYTIDVYTEDYLGNSATQQVTFTIDKTAPEIIEIIAPTVVKDGDTITIKANLSDNLEPIGDLSVTVDASDLGAGTVTLNYNSTSGLYEGSLTVNTGGANYIANLTLTVTDNAGNSNSTEFTIEVDNTAPSLVRAEVISPRYVMVITSENVYDTEDPENFVNNFQIPGITVEDVEMINRTAFKVKVNETPVGTISITMSGRDLVGNTFTDSVQIENTADLLWILQGSGWHFIAFDRIVNTSWNILELALETELGQGGTILTYNGGWEQVTTFDNPLRGFAVYVNTTSYALIPVKFKDYEATSLSLSKGWNLISVVDSSTSVNSFDSTTIGQSSLASLMVNGNPAFSWIYDTNGNLVVSNNFGSLNFVSNIDEATAYWIYLPQAVTYTAPWTPSP